MRAALCAIGLLAYSNCFGTGFALDPDELVLKDTRTRALTAENLSLILRNDYLWLLYPSGLYRPVTTASFLFNYAVLGNGESAGGYHALNLLLHLGNALWCSRWRAGSSSVQDLPSWQRRSGRSTPSPPKP